MKNKGYNKLYNNLKMIKDFREDSAKTKYPLADIIFLCIYALMKGNYTYDEIHFYLEYNKDSMFLKKILNVKEDRGINIPCRSTLHNILVNINLNDFESVFREFFASKADKKSIAVDGKFLNGSDIKGHYLESKHKAILNILDKDSGIVLGHSFIGDMKRSEIPAFKEVLDTWEFSKEKQMFSFDAMLTQVEILNKINSDGNHYIARIKGNQKKLKEKIIQTEEMLGSPGDVYEDKEYSNEGNKFVKRKTELFFNKDTSLAIYSKRFDNIQTIIKTTKHITSSKDMGKITHTVEYLISNHRTSAKQFKEYILKHWAVETYHYFLDVHTKEDAHIAYINPFAMNIARSIVINLFKLYFNKHENTKMKNKRDITMANLKKLAKLSDEFIEELLSQ